MMSRFPTPSPQITSRQRTRSSRAGSGSTTHARRNRQRLSQVNECGFRHADTSAVRGAATLRTFSCFITDDRYTVPTLTFMLVADEKLAREMALRRLLESPHHLNVELLETGERVYQRARAPSEA